MELPALTSHSQAVFWTELLVLVGVARAFGLIARRFGQPAVIGELVAGLVAGPSVFGALAPAWFRWFLPAGHAQGDLLSAVSGIALIVLLVVIGAEADIPLIRSLGAASVAVTVASLAVPFAGGLVLAGWLPADLAGSGHHQVAFDLLVAGAVCVSSLPIVARIVDELGLVRRSFAQLALAAGTVNDTFGFLLLVVATGLVVSGGSTGGLARTGLGLVVVTVGIFTVGQRLVDRLLRRARRDGPSVTASLTVVLLAALAAAVGMQVFGIEGALGGFLAGVVLGRSRFEPREALAHLDHATTAFLAPLFFATAGLRVDLSTLGRPGVLVALMWLTAGAIVLKFAGAATGARLAHRSYREAIALGVTLNGRGTLQVILAAGGLALGVFSTATYTVVIVLAIASSLAVPPFLRLVLSGWEGSPDERSRLEHEARMEHNVVVRGDRILCATAGSPSSLLAAEVVQVAWPSAAEATVVSISPRTGEGRSLEADPPDAGQPGSQGADAIAAVTGVFAGREIEAKELDTADVLDAIVAEANLGYGVLVLGAATRPQPERILSAVVDEVLVRSPIPMVIARTPPTVRRPSAARGSSRVFRAEGSLPHSFDLERSPHDLLRSFGRVLVPVNGTPASRAGEELAGGLAAACRLPAVLTHVITRDVPPPGRTRRPGGPDPSASWAGGRSIVTRRSMPVETGRQILSEAAGTMAPLGVRTRRMIRQGTDAGAEIISAARSTRAGVIVLGASVQVVAGRPFLGHTVEHVLDQTDVAVVVAVVPRGER